MLTKEANLNQPQKPVRKISGRCSDSIPNQNNRIYFRMLAVKIPISFTVFTDKSQ